MLGPFIGQHRLGPFIPRIRIFLGVDLCVIAFVDHKDAFMCIYVGKCPTFGGFSTNYINSMA